MFMPDSGVQELPHARDDDYRVRALSAREVDHRAP